MCGIAGLTGPGLHNRPATILAKQMAEALTHRGPDGAGYFVNSNVALAHRRLKIIDLSSNGSQPLYNEDESIVVVFNGEIYNYLQLRDRLIANGHIFHGRSDGEIIPHLYEEYGHDFVQLLEGMFSIALYDTEACSLLLARDRTGEKPLYYTIENGIFYFASEIKALTRVLEGGISIDRKSVIEFFCHTHVPAPMSVYEQINKLTPGHYLTVDRNLNLEKTSYWNFSYVEKRQNTDLEVLEELDYLLTDVVARTAQSDVPIGLALSGGLDSSLVLGLLAKISGKSFITLSLGYKAGEKQDLELIRAARLSEQYQTEHHVLTFDPYLFSDLEQAIKCFDEPIGIFDALHLTHFSKFVSGYTRVLLTGNGADETFAGYASYALEPNENNDETNVIHSRGERAQFVNDLVAEWYNGLKRVNCKMLYSAMLEEDALRCSAADWLKEYAKLSIIGSSLDAKLFYDLMISCNHTSSLSDVTGMASSVEARSPFLNHRVIEFAASLEYQQKIRTLSESTITKFALKKLGLAYLPADLPFAPKFGCGQFIDYFGLMKTTWKDEAESLLLDYSRELPEYFSIEKIKRLWISFMNGRATSGELMHVRKLFMFLLWHRHRA